MRRDIGRAILGAGLLLCLVGLPMISCSEKSALSRLGDGCQINSDCAEALICVFGVCHEACQSSKDCPGGRCVFNQDHIRVCQLNADASCTFNSECPPALVCGIDGSCRNECADDRDCVEGQICTSAVCADVGETQNGQLPNNSEASVGAPCSYSSQCPPSDEGLTLACRAGRCSYACFEERDCARFYRCTTADDPTVPGECVLIGAPGSLFCDPDDDPPEGHPCDCFGGVTGSQFCKPDGSGYDECLCN